jgi:SOS response regulatory protein OraA/RecX
VSERLLKVLARKALSVAEAESLTNDVALLDVLLQRGMLNDHRLANDLAGTFTGKRARGDVAIRAALQQRLIPPDLIDAAIEKLPDEVERARALMNHSNTRDYRKFAGYLTRRGFSEETVSIVCQFMEWVDAE